MQGDRELGLSEKRVLIIEDEAALAEIVRDYLIDASMHPTLLADGANAVETILSEHFDLLVLDLMLPVKDGLTICREVRQKSDLPIIMVTAKVEELDRLIGLELGADDYICKPFSPRELVARIKAIFRRVDKSTPKSNRPEERFIVDTERWLATLDGKSVELTRREFKLLEILHARPGRVFSRSQLLDMAFPDDSDVIDRTIDSHIKNIRNKIKAVADWDPIRSVYGVGYAFDE
ncbi:MAG: response regulator [Hyphomicrobiales bacterium]